MYSKTVINVNDGMDETRSIIFKNAQNVLVLDGGFGSTLETNYHKDISTPLWSASLIEKEPRTVIAAHLEFLRAGAEVLTTATYQCSFQTYDRAGYSHEDAVQLMKRGVKLAVEAREIYLKEIGKSHEQSIKIALSLGPFGAALYPAQEFDGFYPPPYGPRTYSRDGENSNVFPDGDVDGELDAERMLTLFHLERLEVFAKDEQIWQFIDVLAFETVPLAREIRAIRRAVGSLDGVLPKVWWISTVWPGGHFPQGKNKYGNGSLGVRDVFDAMFGDVAKHLPAPEGFGVNCTTIESMEAVVSKMGEIVRVHHRPFLVIYPNGGDLYDIIERRWITTAVPASPKDWAHNLAGLVHRELRSGTWSGIIVGGCCRTYPEHIRILASTVCRT